MENQKTFPLLQVLKSEVSGFFGNLSTKAGALATVRNIVDWKPLGTPLRIALMTARRSYNCVILCIPVPKIEIGDRHCPASLHT